MMEDVQTRIQYAVGKMISTLDKEVLRKLQVIFCYFFAGAELYMAFHVILVKLVLAPDWRSGRKPCEITSARSAI